MLTRLSLRLENDFNPKQKTREEIEKQPALQKAAPVYVSREIKGADGKTEALEIDEDFDRAWRRVGVGLDRVGLNIEDRVLPAFTTSVTWIRTTKLRSATTKVSSAAGSRKKNPSMHRFIVSNLFLTVIRQLSPQCLTVIRPIL